MINLLLGAPGGGKSYEAVAYHALPAIQSGRRVVTNLPLQLDVFEAIVPGCSSLIEIRTATKASRPAPKIVNISGYPRDLSRSEDWSDRAFAHVEDYQDPWRDEDGRGPLYIIDECHFCLPVGRTDRAVEEWFSMHRHYNVDVLLITQSYGKVSRAIVDLVQVCYKVRKATALGNSDGYVRKVLDGVRGGEVSVQQRKYQAKYFKLYKSHTHGTALTEKDADDVSPLIVKFNRFKWFWLALSVVAMVWAFWPVEGENIFGARTSLPPVAKPIETPPLAKISPTVPAGEGVRPELATIVPAAPETPAAPPAEPAKAAPDEPLSGKRIHIIGFMAMGKKHVVMFTVSGDGQRQFDVTSADLTRSGYRWEQTGDCLGWLEYMGHRRAVTCDAPVMAKGAQDRPITFDSSTGIRSDATARISAHSPTHPASIEIPLSAPGQQHVTVADVAAAYSEQKNRP